MKIAMIGAMAVAALAIVGCDEKKDASAAATEATAAVDKNAVMVSVNGKTLTRGQIDADVEKILEMRRAQIPAEQIEEARKAFGEQVAQQFLMKTLLLDEAEKKGVKVTDEEKKKREEEFVKANAGRPDAPKSIAEFAEKYPLGKDRGLQEFADGILIQKLLEQEVVSKIKVDAAAIEAQVKKAMDDAAEAKKKAAGAEAKIKDLKKQLDGLKGEELAKKFAELAKANSDCPSKEKGGDLGEFQHGQMVPEFDKVAFEQPVNTVSEPVKTQFGWHLVMPTKKTAAVEAKGDQPAQPEKVQASHILVMAREGGAIPTKEQVEQRMKRQQEQTAMRDYFEKLRTTATIEAPGYPQLVPQKAPAAPKVIESAPVEAKPAEAKK